MIDYDSFSRCHLTDIFFRFSRVSKRVKGRHFFNNLRKNSRMRPMNHWFTDPISYRFKDPLSNIFYSLPPQILRSNTFDNFDA